MARTSPSKTLSLTASRRVNARIDAHVEDINKRLYDLEKVVFKASEPSTDDR
jgi:hypothetical protein